MAHDDKSRTNLANGSVIFVAIVATGTYFFHREAPLLDSRPAVAEASISEPTRRADHRCALMAGSIRCGRQSSRQIENGRA